ncbi:MAG TPA: arylsulfotransferase family protein [Gemmatimonadaceae bacterium]|nr:arylsulfotransferase family protein [Gemmatimonadaceae bacterium]
MRRPGVRNAALIAAGVVLYACTDGDEGGGITTPVRCDLPVIGSRTLEANPRNVLAAAFRAHVQGADSGRVRHRPTASAGDSLTPAVAVAGDSVEVPVLGLLPGTDYTMSLTVYGRCGVITAPPITLTTGALPADLPAYSAEGSDPSPGYVSFAAGSYGLVIDNTGRVVWYHRFDNGAGLNFQPQPNGRYVARPPSPDPNAPWVELDVLGRVTRTLSCARGFAPRFHDLIIDPDGSYWVMCDEIREMDLSAAGGPALARVSGTGVQHLGPAGEVLFAWSPFDHFEVSGWDPPMPGQANVNWTHGNAIALDADGNLLISFRNLSEIAKIDARTGDVLWRLGGVHNEFTFVEQTSPLFARQHGVRLDARGELVFLDNLGDATGSRTLRYALDEGARTARLLAVYRPDQSVVAQVGGTTQPLPPDRTLVSYGSGGRVEEYDGAGRVVWRIAGNPGYIFRAQRVRSLYAPGAAAAR